MENFFSRLGLDIIGKAVFNYDFDSLAHDDPVIQVRCPMCRAICGVRNKPHATWQWVQPSLDTGHRRGGASGTGMSAMNHDVLCLCASLPFPRPCTRCCAKRSTAPQRPSPTGTFPASSLWCVWMAGRRRN